MNNPRLRTDSGKQDGRDFNNRGGERGRQPISFRSCEHTDQKAAQVAIAPPGQLSDVKTKLMEVTQTLGGQKQSKVDQTQMRMVQSQDDRASQRREEVGKLQEDRSKAVIAKAISEATKAVEKASTEAQSYTAGGREGSDGKLSSRMSSPIEQVREVNRQRNHSIPQRRTSRRGRESEHDCKASCKARGK